MLTDWIFFYQKLVKRSAKKYSVECVKKHNYVRVAKRCLYICMHVCMHLCTYGWMYLWMYVAPSVFGWQLDFYSIGLLRCLKVKLMEQRNIIFKFPIHYNMFVFPSNSLSLSHFSLSFSHLLYKGQMCVDSMYCKDTWVCVKGAVEVGGGRWIWEILGCCR
jgi:hypothetical protein